MKSAKTHSREKNTAILVKTDTSKLSDKKRDKPADTSNSRSWRWLLMCISLQEERCRENLMTCTKSLIQIRALCDSAFPIGRTFDRYQNGVRGKQQ
jgi:hypothetical protein